MRKSNWFRRHEKGIVTGFFAAVLTVTGAAGYHIQDSYGYTYSYDKNGVTFTEIVPGSSEVTWDTAETYVSDDSSREAVVEDRQVDRQRRYDVEYGYGSPETAIAMESGDDWWDSEESDLYESLGMKWDKKEHYWTYKDKPVRIIWVADGCFSSWGNTDKKDCTYIFISKKYGEGSVTYQLEELTLEELQQLYTKEHPGSWIE
ncbi:hypothetical protein [Ruminococcus sp. 5_1_39BFAA]|uniref:hypothetical protein n=1 Tax=Ruminococcus sp. 5_1_39BFAA TaxID=457412 RepID=UPI00356542FD